MILVTGGTGLVGSHLLYLLLKEGNKVRAIHRKGSNLNIIDKVFSYYTEDTTTLLKNLEWCEANIIDIPSLTAAFEDITHVYHAAAYIDFNPKNYTKLKKVNIEGTANVVNLSISNSVKKLCFVSSIATLGDVVGSNVLDEETQWNPEAKNSVYAITKYGAEMEVWRGSQEGLNAVIVNPGIILGEGLWHKGSGGIVKRVSKGLKYYTTGSIGVVDVKDVIKAMVTLMNSNIKNRRFILVAENRTYKNFLGCLAEKLGLQKPSKEIAKWKLVVFSKIEWFISFFFGTKRKLLRTHVDTLYKCDTYDGSAITEAVSFNYTSLEKTMERVTQHFKKEHTFTAPK
jgi:nucleoside-diphosphate-sugar epimerase